MRRLKSSIAVAEGRSLSAHSPATAKPASVTRPPVTCPGCGEDRLIDFDPVPARFICLVCSRTMPAERHP